MDRASQVLVEGLPAGEPTTYVALAEWGNVPYSTLNHWLVRMRMMSGGGMHWDIWGMRAREGQMGITGDEQ